MKSVFPVNYDLEFEPDFDKFKFRGHEKILIQARSAKKIVLNCAEIEIKKCQLVVNDKILKPKLRMYPKKEEMVLIFSKRISGKAVLLIDFIGTLNDRLVGFYRSRYKHNGKERYLASTQFEAADARRAFPCWDEPSAKATFDISFIVDNNLKAISNMPVILKKRVGKKTLYRFERTPIMSTYLVYLGVGDFEFLRARQGKTLIRIVTTRGKRKLGRMALKFTKEFLSYFQNYFKIPYPLPKLDMIAVPDFAAGAMENWGAITFRETVLLYDPKTSSTETKQHIAEVIAHELAHQWFGNLVTMKWWNDLWLNESFATFMATKAVDKTYQEWDFWDQFLISEMTGGLSLDSLKSSHPIDVDVKSPTDIRQIFDEISYNKGGSILMMLENFIGKENFRKGLYNYLKKHEYSNATTDDLWHFLGSASRQPVGQIMNTWVRQVGYPIVEATKSDSRILLSQKRFLLGGNGKVSKGNWIIPLSVRTEDHTISKLMKGRLSLPFKGKWFKVNESQRGFYRVKYDTETLETLGEVIEQKGMSNLDRWSIHHDLVALCVSNQVSLRQYLDFLRHYEEEDDYIVLSDIVACLNTLYIFLSDEKIWDEIKQFNKYFMRIIFQKIGWDPVKGEKPTYAMLRNMLISSLVKLEDEEISEEAKLRFSRFIKSRELNPDLRGAIYSAVAWNGDSRTYKQLLNMYKKAPSQEEKIRLLGSLANFRDKKILTKTLAFLLSKEVRTQNLYLPVLRMSLNPYGKQLVWPWIRKNWKRLVERFGTGHPVLNRIVGSISVLSDEKQEKEIKQFFNKHSIPGTEMKVAQTLERIRINSMFVKNVKKNFGD